jgi:hypothetical protein
MRNSTGVAAFCLAALTLLPGLRALDADDAPSGPATRPPLSSLDLGSGRRVEVSSDARDVSAGSTVHVELRTVGAIPCDVRVRVSLKKDEASLLSRVPTPPVTVESREVALAGGAPRDVSFRLPRADHDRVVPGGVTSFSVFIEPAGVGPIGPAAVVSFFAHEPEAFSLRIDAEKTAPGHLAASVTVQNRTRRPLDGIRVYLAGEGPHPFSVTRVGADEPLPALAPLETREVRFSVESTDRRTTFSLVAYGYGAGAGESRAHRRLTF